MAKRKSSRSSFKYPLKSTDVPVTQTMLFLVRDELSAKLSEVDRRLGAQISQLDAKTDGQATRIAIEIHQIKLLIEEQNARNIFVLDGLRSLFDRQDRLEKKIDQKRQL